HVEAGRRSFDWSMTEELNRVPTDHASGVLLCSTEGGMVNLRHEAAAGSAERGGDVMVYVAMATQPQARERSDLVQARGLEPGEFLLATAHRAGNVDDPGRLTRLVGMLTGLPLPVILPLHPRTDARLRAAGLRDRLAEAPGVVLVDPLGYFELTAL